MSPWSSRAAIQLHALRNHRALGLDAPALVARLRMGAVASTLRLTALRHRLRPGATPYWSRVCLWVDGYQAVSLGENTHPLALSMLKQPCDAASALAAVEAVAPRPAKRGLHFVRVLIGAPFVHYLALPWRPLPKAADWLAAARTQFIRDGMGAPDGWRFCVHDAPWQRMRLAVAVPEALCGGVEAICKSQGLWLSAIEPGFTHALSHHARHVQDGAIALIEVEQGSPEAVVANVAFRREGGWAGLVTLPLATSLGDLLRDARMLCRQGEPERTYVIAPRNLRDDAARCRGAQWLPLPWCPHA